jgi:23S rRNA (uracil1939-C5)-methyltransferase
MNRPHPVHPTETLDLDITVLGAQGDGIAEHNGERLFVPYTVAGDRVRARRSGDRALPLDYLQLGPQRQTPPCPHFGPGRCGGCALQHVDDAAYAEWKVAALTETLDRAGLRGFRMNALARTKPGERRRAEFLVRVEREGVTLGFHVRGSHEAVDIGPCPVLTPALEALIPRLRTFFASWPTRSAFDALVTETDSGVELALTRAPTPNTALRVKIAAFASDCDLPRITTRSGPHATSEILDQRRPVQMTFGDVAVELPPGTFLQASRSGEHAILTATRDAIGNAKRIADLYCGVGTLGLALAKGRRSIYAAERSAEAIQALQAGARRGGIGEIVRAETRDLMRRPLIGDELEKLDAVIFDPPREGAAEQARALAKSKVRTIVAVSCNATTFARDARTLIDGGYRLEEITPVDQFLWSPHIELVGVFR